MKEIRCKKCDIVIMTHDEKGNIPKVARCKQCGRYLEYVPATQRVKYIAQPTRQSSSGMRFY